MKIDPPTRPAWKMVPIVVRLLPWYSLGMYKYPTTAPVNTQHLVTQNLKTRLKFLNLYINIFNILFIVLPTTCAARAAL